MKQSNITLEQAECNHVEALDECRRYAAASSRCTAGLAERLGAAQEARSAAGAALADALLDGSEQKPDGKVARALTDALTGAERDREASRQLSARWAQAAGNEAAARRALIAGRIDAAVAARLEAKTQAEDLRKQLAELERRLAALDAAAGDGGLIDRLEIEAEHAELAEARRVRCDLVWLDEAAAEDQTFWPHVSKLMADPAWPVDRAALLEILEGWRGGLRATDPEHLNWILYPRRVAILWDAATGAIAGAEILDVMNADGRLVRGTDIATTSDDRLAAKIREAETRLGTNANAGLVRDYIESLQHPDHHIRETV